MSFIYSMADAWASSGTVFTSMGMSVSDTGHAAGSKLLRLTVNTVDVFTIDPDGTAYSKTQTYGDSSLKVATTAFVAANAAALNLSNTNLGTFTGVTIPDNVSAKVGMQALETALEANNAYSQTATYAAGTVGKALQRIIDVTQPPYNSTGDNSTDDYAAWAAAIAYCQAHNFKLVAPRRNYVFSQQLVITSPIDIDVDPSATLRWTNTGSCGVWLDDRASGSNYGLYTANLGQLYSPACSSSFVYPGYPSAWTPAARVGDAVKVTGGSRFDINVKTMLGWSKGFNVASTNDGYGVRAPQNVNLRVNTIDITTYAFYLDGGPSGAAELTAISIWANTVFAKFPVYLDSSVNPISAVSAVVDGQAFTNEAGGAVIYEYGSQTNSCRFDFAWVYAGYGSDSPTGTSATLQLPYLAGAQSSHSLTTDGNATVGYFGGYGNSFNFGVALQLVSSPGAALPAAGGVVRIRDAGAYNHVNVNYHNQNIPAIALSTTVGEANYNGGVGGAALGKRIWVSCAVPTLGNFSTATFYFYHSWLSVGGARPTQIIFNDSSIQNSGLKVEVIDQSGTTNRQGAVVFTNLTGGSVTGATYYFWIEVMN